MFHTEMAPDALAVAYWVEAVLAALAFATFVSIFWLRVRAERHKEQVRVSQAQARACLDKWLNNEPSELSLQSRTDVRELLKIWIHRACLIEGAQRQVLLRHGKAAGLQTYIARLLVSGLVQDELLALKACAVLQEQELLSPMLPLLKSRNNVVTLFAAEAIAATSHYHALNTILPMLAQQTTWSEKKVVDLYRAIVRNSHTNTRRMLDLVLQQGAKPQAFAAKFLSGQPFDLRAPYLSELLRKAADDKVISACLDGLQEPLSAELARRYLNHPRWHVRVHAIQAIGRIGSAQDEPALIKKLSDTQWWVRYRAAQALVNMPGLSEQALQEIYQNLNDRFSRDILVQAASEAGRHWGLRAAA